MKTHTKNNFLKLALKLKYVIFCLAAPQNLLAERVIFVDTENSYFIVDKNPEAMQPQEDDHICLLDDAGLLVSCRALILVNDKRLAIYLPRIEMQKLKVGTNLILRLRNIFLLDGQSLPDLTKPLVFRPAKNAPTTMIQALKKLAKRQLEVIEKALPSIQATNKDRPSKESTEGDTKKEGELKPPSTNAPEEIKAAPLSGITQGIDYQSPYDAKLNEALKNIEKRVENYPDLSGLKLDYVIKDGKIIKKDVNTNKEENEQRLVAKGNLREHLNYTEYTLSRIIEIRGPLQYGVTQFNTIRGVSTGIDLWKKKQQITTPQDGILLKASFYQGSPWFKEFGLMHYVYSRYNLRSQLIEGFPELSTRSETLVSTFGVYFSQGRRWYPNRWYFPSLSYGLQYHQSEISFLSEYGVSTSSSVLGYQAGSLRQFGLRFGFDQLIDLGYFALHLGAHSSLTLYSMYNKLRNSVTVPEDITTNGSSADQLRSSIGFKTNTLFFGGHLGISLQF